MRKVSIGKWCRKNWRKKLQYTELLQNGAKAALYRKIAFSVLIFSITIPFYLKVQRQQINWCVQQFCVENMLLISLELAISIPDILID